MTSNDWLVVSTGDSPSFVVPIIGRLQVGRKSGGTSGPSQLLLDDPAISRDHFELRADPVDGVVLLDHSTNGTRVNGNKVGRDEPLSLTDGDFLELGTIRMSFRSLDAPRADLRRRARSGSRDRACTRGERRRRHRRLHGEGRERRR